MIVDLDRNSLSDFKDNTADFLRRLKESGRAVVLTVDGKAELVVQDSSSYQKLVDLAERVERKEALHASVDDYRAGKVSPAEDMLTEMREILAKHQGR